MRRSVPAFTLIELMAVTVLLVGAVGWATLSLRHLGDNGKLELAAARVMSAYRLAALHSEGSGLPLVVRCTSLACVVRKRRWAENEWQWMDAATFELPPSVVIRRVVGPEGSVGSGERGPWMLIAPANGAWWEWNVTLCIGAERCAELNIDAFTGEDALRFIEHKVGI